MSHLDIVVQQHNLTPPDNRSPEGVLAFVLRVLAALPAEEGAGLLRKDGGENIAFYPPAQCNVSISRVCYPDGKIWKILTDAGVGGTNGPAWNDDGFVEPNRYIRIIENHPGPTEPKPPKIEPKIECKYEPCKCNCKFDIAPILAKLDQLWAEQFAMTEQVAELKRLLEARTAFPAYSGRLGLNLRLTPEK